MKGVLTLNKTNFDHYINYLRGYTHTFTCSNMCAIVVLPSSCTNDTGNKGHQLSTLSKTSWILLADSGFWMSFYTLHESYSGIKFCLRILLTSFSINFRKCCYLWLVSSCDYLCDYLQLCCNLAVILILQVWVFFWRVIMLWPHQNFGCLVLDHSLLFTPLPAVSHGLRYQYIQFFIFWLALLFLFAFWLVGWLIFLHT